MRRCFPPFQFHGGIDVRGKENSTAKAADFAPVSKRHFLKTAAALTAGAAFSGTRAFAADKDTIRIGYISPRTGPFAPFAEADEFIIGQIRKATAAGISVGGKNYKVELIARDDQSNPDRASNLAVELINKQGIDLMLAQGALGVVPVSQQCELNGIPCITTMTPWQAWLFPLKGDPAKEFKNVFHFFWGVEDIASVYLDIWSDLPTNKVVGSVFSNDVPGNAMGDLKLGMPGLFAAAGYKIVDIGKFPIGSDDFSNYIQAFKRTMSRLSRVCLIRRNGRPFSTSLRRWVSSPRSQPLPKPCCFRAALPRSAPAPRACRPRSGGFLPIRSAQA